MASGPPGAAFAIGICRKEQEENADPTTATTSRLRAYAFAFEPQRKMSEIPDCAVDESHDWYPTENAPASYPRCSRTSRMASTMGRVTSRISPWSGRSETISRSGAPLPVECRLSRRRPGGRSASDDGGRPDVTQTAPSPASTSRGDVARRDLVDAIRHRIDPVDEVGDLVGRPHGSVPDGHARDPGADIVGPLLEARLHLDAPHATPDAGRPPTRHPNPPRAGEAGSSSVSAIRRATAWRAWSISARPVPSVTQTRPSPVAMFSAADVVDGREHAVRPRIDARDRTVGVDRPDRVVGHGDVLPADAAEVVAVPSRGPRGQLDRRDDQARRRRRTSRCSLVGHPRSRTSAGRCHFRPTAQPNPTAMSVGVDAVPNVRRTSRVCGSILETVLSSASMTQTEPSPRATFDGVVPSGTRTVTPVVSGSSTTTCALSVASPRGVAPVTRAPVTSVASTSALTTTAIVPRRPACADRIGTTDGGTA